MIACATAIEHGKAMTLYDTKDFRADFVRVNHLPDGLPPLGLWDQMCLHMDRYRQKFRSKPIKRTSIRIEVSPTMDESKEWILDDWRKYCDELVRELDKVDRVKGVRDNKIHVVTPTNIEGSQYFAVLHHDAKSGIPHLHLVVNRIDMNGNINDAHFIGERAVAAAQTLNERYGWADPMKIREEHLKRISGDCIDVLRNMRAFNWNVYRSKLTQLGYGIDLRHDSHGKVVAYSISMGNSHYKASELGTGRNLTVKNIEATFRKLHGLSQESMQPDRVVSNNRHAERKSIEERYFEAMQKSRQNESSNAIPQKPSTSNFSAVWHIGDNDYNVNIPYKLYNTIRDEITENRDMDASQEDTIKVASLLFMGYISAATTAAASSGGSGSSGSGWGRKCDEDENEWARRCAQKASWLCKPVRRRRGR